MTYPSTSNEISGWLSKWTNVIGGYQKRWFVLSDGMLSYYKTPAEKVHTCRGTISLAGATLDFDETCKFVISQNGYAYHVKADNQADKQRWVAALTSARDSPNGFQSTQIINTDSQVSLADGPGPSVPKRFDTRHVVTLMSTMKNKLKEIQANHELIHANGTALQETMSKIETFQQDGSLRELNNHAAGFKATVSSMINACSDYLDMAESHSRQWVALFRTEQEQRAHLEKIVKSLTRVQSQSPSASSDDESSNEYYDCSDTDLCNGISISHTVKVFQVVNTGGTSKSNRRTRVPDRPNVSASLWTILKSCIGKDLTKMPLPVAFAEPLSLLQRLTEDFEYAQILDKAAEFSDPSQQLTHIAAFVISTYSTTIGRIGKPFNPLLGETFECDRQNDLGWRSIAEQVSHHPPVAAVHCEGKQWEVWMEESMKTKFGGTTLSVIPTGECHMKFKNGNTYSWRKATTQVHNIIVGKLWVEQEGDTEIKCHSTGHTCKITYITSGWFGSDLYGVKGQIKDQSGKAVYDISGKYSTQIEVRPAGAKEPVEIVWKRTAPPADNGKYYNFTLFACTLNELEDGVAPTDSRFRPDQRLMEEGKFDEANIMKRRIEDHQRANKSDSYQPSWFKKQLDPNTKTNLWTYQGEYWPCKTKKDWARCPAYIFTPTASATTIA